MLPIRIDPMVDHYHISVFRVPICSNYNATTSGLNHSPYRHFEINAKVIITKSSTNWGSSDR